MAEIQSSGLRTKDCWNGTPSRAAGLYGELQPLPLPVVPPVSSAMTRKPRSRPTLTD